MDPSCISTSCFANVRADAQAALAAVSIIRLPEHVEDVGQLLGIEPDPVVDHAYGDGRLVGRGVYLALLLSRLVIACAIRAGST